MEQVHEGQRAQQRHDDGNGRDQGGAAVSQEQEDDDDDEDGRDGQGAFDVGQRGARGDGAVDGQFQVDLGRQLGAQDRQGFLDAIDGGDDVGAGFLRDADDDGRFAVGQAQIVQVFRPVGHGGDVRQAHRGAIARGDDEAGIVGGLERLVVGVDLQLAVAVAEIPLGLVGIGRRNGGPNILRRDAVGGKRPRIIVDAHGRRRAAAQRNVADAIDLRQFLLQDVRRRVVDLGVGHGLGLQVQHDDRRIRRVDLAVGRIGAQGRRQVGARRGNGRLDVAGGAVDVAVQAELQRDIGAAGRAVRRHFGDVGDQAEMSFQRGRDRGRHDFGRAAGHVGAHLDRRKIDGRQRRHRQDEPRRHSCQRDADGQEDGGDGPPDKGLGQGHSAIPGAVSCSGPWSVGGAFGLKRAPHLSNLT